jgi:succinoglycan biosynthesis protein ExoV
MKTAALHQGRNGSANADLNPSNRTRKREMKVFFCKVDGGNFGDDMNEWFWDELFSDYRDLAPGSTLFGIGSILWRENFLQNDNVIVMGSGSGYGVIPNELPESARIGFVRGPRTARLLNLPPDMAITDPAVMVPTFERFKDVRKTGDVTFIPHVGTAKLPLNWEGIASRAGVTYLSPARDSHDVIRQLAGSSLVLAESLHGAIIADAFRVPWLPLAISPTFNDHKWRDWADSLEMQISFQEFLLGLKRMRSLASRVRTVVGGRKPAEKSLDRANAGHGGTHVAPSFSKDDKTAARKWVTRLSPLIETMFVNDLRKAKKIKGFLSSDAILKERQSQILDRVAQVRERLAASSQ